MQSANVDILREAIARNAGGVLSLPSAGMLRHHKTRFLCMEDSGFWIEAPPPSEQTLVNQIIAAGQPVGLSLKAAINKVVFTSSLLRFCENMAINRNMRLNALLVVWPEELKAVQRRNDYRVSVPLDSEVAARAWRINEQHLLRDRPAASAMIKASLRNVSAGGMGLACQFDEGESRIIVDQRLRIALVHGGGELILEARVKHLQPLPSGEYRMGVQFKKLEADLQGRQTLASLSLIIGQLQREEIRRRRLSRSA